LGTINDKDRGIAHVPVNRQKFISVWEPLLIMKTEVALVLKLAPREKK
jgi:hypothetical protein